MQKTLACHAERSEASTQDAAPTSMMTDDESSYCNKIEACANSGEENVVLASSAYRSLCPSPEAPTVGVSLW
jgi:hypothetical protein